MIPYPAHETPTVCYVYSVLYFYYLSYICTIFGIFNIYIYMLSPPKIYHSLGFLAVLTICTRFQPEGNIGVVTTCPWWIFRISDRQKHLPCEREVKQSIFPQTQTIRRWCRACKQTPAALCRPIDRGCGSSTHTEQTGSGHKVRSCPPLWIDLSASDP